MLNYGHIVKFRILKKFTSIISPGNVVEVSGNRQKTHVLLWSIQQQDYGKKLIRVDGYTRNNLSIGIDDNVYVRRVITSKGEQIVLSPTEGLNDVGLEDITRTFGGSVISKCDIIPINMMGRKIGFLVTTIILNNSL